MTVFTLTALVGHCEVLRGTGVVKVGQGVTVGHVHAEIEEVC